MYKNGVIAYKSQSNKKSAKDRKQTLLQSGSMPMSGAQIYQALPASAGRNAYSLPAFEICITWN